MKTFLRNFFTRAKSVPKAVQFKPQCEVMEERLVMDTGGLNQLGSTVQTATVVDNNGVVTVEGTDGNDEILIGANGDEGILVIINWKSMHLVDNLIRMTVSGRRGDDTITLVGQRLLPGFSTIYGGEGEDTLIGPELENTWNIYGYNNGALNSYDESSGKSSGGSNLFRDIEHLVGNSKNDTFSFSLSPSITTFAPRDSGHITGTIDGGQGDNTLDFSAIDRAVTVTMVTPTTLQTDLVEGGASNVDAVTGSSYTDTFVGTDASTGWSIYNYDQAVMWRSAPLSKFYIRGFNNLTSGAGNDTFWIAPKRGMSGLVDTGDGDDSIFMQSNSRVDDTLIDGNSITLAGWTSTFANAERLQIDLGDGNSTTTIDAFPDVDEFILNGGNDEDVLHVNTVVPAGMTVSYHGMGGNDTLVGPDIFYNNWFISGLNSGSIYDQSEWSTFDGFENLTGGSDLEYFAIYPNGSISGAIDGGGGRDIINYKWYSSGVRVDLTNGTATGVGHISNVPRIIGSPFADFLRGDEQSNYINGYNRGTDVTDVILGMGGDDLLYGGGIIIGGQGQDDLVGSSGEDLIIADSTIYDDHEQVELIFTELLELWRRQDLSFEERVDLLRNGHSISGLGTVALNSSTIQDDGRVDRIQGMSGRDWYFAALAEAIDFDPDEDRLN